VVVVAGAKKTFAADWSEGRLLFLYRDVPDSNGGFAKNGE